MKKNLKDFAIKLKDFAKKTQGFSKKTQGFVRKLNASEATSLSRPPKKRSINKPALQSVPGSQELSRVGGNNFFL